MEALELTFKLGHSVGAVHERGESSFPFVRDILINFRGDVRMYPVCRALVECLPEGDERLQSLEDALMGTGVVSGELGFVDAFKKKKEEIGPWLNDPLSKVQKFAVAYIRRLDLRIADEQRRGEQRREIRRRDWDNDPEN